MFVGLGSTALVASPLAPPLQGRRGVHRISRAARLARSRARLVRAIPVLRSSRQTYTWRAASC